MSVWRDIWKESLRANRIMAEDEEDGQIEFHQLFKKYGDDGMLHYALGEAWEYRKDFQKAIEEYTKAKELFPVPHWKKVAADTMERVSSKKTVDAFFNKDDFADLHWYAFQKIYEYVYLDDFVRYVCLSAVSRASSEWPLSLVDFRSVLELQIKKTFSQIVKSVKERNNDYASLNELICELEKKKYIKIDIINSMHQIRKEGNLATHDMERHEDGFIGKEDFDSIKNFLNVLDFFNTYNKNHQESD